MREDANHRKYRYSERGKAVIKAYRVRNKDRLKKYRKESYLKYDFIYNMKRLYNLSIEEYNELLEIQGGKCAICGVDFSLLKRKPCVDHDHFTKKVRGLLCCYCNPGLGNFKDDIARLQQAIKYLVNNQNDPNSIGN